MFHIVTLTKGFKVAKDLSGVYDLAGGFLTMQLVICTEALLRMVTPGAGVRGVTLCV